MALRFVARYLVLCLTVVTVIGCSTPSTSTRAGSGDPEKDLRIMSAALQRSILEGAAAGGVVGPGFFYRRSVKPANAAAGGAAVGAAAGAYVGWVQATYASEEDRLEQIKSDLDRNSAEVQATINVMRDVLALQNSELAAIRAKARSGAADSQALATEVAEAQANLGEMQKAISGASFRERELTASRGLVPASGGGSRIDPELESLSGQIAAMRDIAADLAENLG